MGGYFGNTAGIAGEDAPAWDRFAHWPQLRARLGLLALFLLLIASALVPIASKTSTPTFETTSLSAPDTDAPKVRDDDLALYDRVIARIRNGENYYDFIVEEQRQSGYPVRPGLVVRLPTLAYIQAWIGEPAQPAIAFLLMGAILMVWWRRLGEERRLPAMLLILAGVAMGLNRYYFVLHELWVGMLLALAFGLHRPGKWGASLAVAALAVAIREHALPFILLMAAMAFWRRDWKEGAAWSGVAAVFLIGLAIHLRMIALQVQPDDPSSPPWLVLRGLSGWLSYVVQSGNLRLLPHWLAGPMVILMVTGWAGWRSSAGVFGTFLYLGYGLAFMLAGRANNFYWGAVVLPVMPVGLLFAPRAIMSLASSAFPAPAPHFAPAK
jgi:hypothetical protein